MINSAPSRHQFAALQERLRRMFQVEPNAARTRTILVIPSFTVDRDLLIHNPELQYWEHRMLYLLSELRNPAVRVIYVTSREVSHEALSYSVRLQPDLSPEHLTRLRLITCSNSMKKPLVESLLHRPDLLLDLRQAIELTDDAYIECFACTEAERDLAYTLDIPIYGPDPALNSLGHKSQSRRIFRTLGIPLPEGIEGVHGIDELVEALVAIKRQDPWLRQAVVKLDDSLGGVGNAVFSYSGAPGRAALREWVRNGLESRLELAMSIIDRDRFFDRVASSGCIVESFVEGTKRSPSVQCEIRPTGEVLIVSSHEQHVTGAGGQHFSGCFLPAKDPGSIHSATRLVGEALRSQGVIGWFGVDFVVAQDGPRTRSYALEINLRNLGTVHHLMTLKNLTGGEYIPESGLFLAADRQARYYFGSDSVRLQNAVGLSSSEVLADAAGRKWMYRVSSEAGVVLHMIDAVRSYGRIGLTCIGRSAAESYSLYGHAVRELEQLGGESAQRPTKKKLG